MTIELPGSQGVGFVDKKNGNLMVIYKFHYSVPANLTKRGKSKDETSGSMMRACWAIMTLEFDLPVSMVN